MIRQLEIGPGEIRLPGQWVTLDCVARPGVVDHICRWGDEPLPFADESFELVYAAHVLEHIPWHETVAALAEAWRVLAPRGRLELHVPDLSALLRAVEAECCLDDHAERGLNDELHWMHWVAERLFHLGPDEAWHRACFNAPHLRWCLTQAGFVDVEPITTERGSDHGVINLGFAAHKPADPAQASPRQATAGEPVAVVAIREPQILISEKSANRASRERMLTLSRESLPPCHSRREYAPDEGVFFCAHPQVHIKSQLVLADICRGCDKWQQPPPDTFRPFRSELGAIHDGPCWNLGGTVGLRRCSSCRGKVLVKVLECRHPLHGPTTADECLVCPDYEQRLRRGTIAKWAVGVTTAPRSEVTLDQTLANLDRAGWSNPRIFAEPNSPLPADLAAEAVTCRSTQLGAWTNFFLGLVELCQRQPWADAYLMVQDDVRFCRHLRGYLEHALWPAPRLGVVTLYNPARPDDQPPGFAEAHTTEGLPGALALVFPNYAARLFVGDPYVLAHCRSGAVDGTRLIDVVVGQWAARSGLSAWEHFPSLAQHTGDRTTIWGPGEDAQPRQSPTFVGEDFDARSLLDTPTMA